MILRKCLTGLPLFLYLLLLALLLQLLPGFLLPTVRAQAPEKSLATGQLLPEVTLARMVNYASPTARLSDFKGKLLIIDFWATWCSACKAAMPKLDALQKEFPGQVQVLLVTRDEEAKVRTFFKKWKNKDGTPYQLPSAVNDTALDKLFPYRLVPHIVWIRPDGTVGTTTTSEQVTAANIRRALADGTMPGRVKKDIDLQQPLFADAGLPTANLAHYSILLKGKIDGLPSGSRFRKKDGLVVGRAITNQPLLNLYTTVALQMIPDYTSNRLLLEVKDEGPLLQEKSGASPDAWQLENLYSYDLTGPSSEAGSLYTYMLEDLNRYTAYRGTIEKRPTQCLVLVLTGSPGKLQTKGGPEENTLYQPGPKRMRNAPIAYLMNQLLSEPGIRLPVLNETGYTGNIDLDISAALDDLPALRKELRRYNLDLVTAERPIDMLVIRDKQTDTPAQNAPAAGR